MSRRRVLTLAVAGLVAAAAAGMGTIAVLGAPDTALPWSVFGSGGNTSSSTNYALGSTSGQSSPIGVSGSTGYKLEAGFWHGTAACIDRLGDTSCADPVNDPDDDGCTTAEEAALGSVFDGTAAGWYDVYDVPAPAKSDAAGANGVRNKVVDLQDVLAVLLHVFATDNGPPNGNGVDYDSIKGVDLNGDSTNDAGVAHGIEEGLKYDRSPGPGPDPVTGIDPVGPPNGDIDFQDVLGALAQAFVVDCTA